jgi:hypothetical protein
MTYSKLTHEKIYKLVLERVTEVSTPGIRIMEVPADFPLVENFKNILGALDATGFEVVKWEPGKRLFTLRPRVLTPDEAVRYHRRVKEVADLQRLHVESV